MLSTFVSVRKLMCMDHIARQKHESALDTYLPTLPLYLGVSKFFIISPGLPVRAPNLPEIPSVAFFNFFSSISLFSRGQKGK